MRPVNFRRSPAPISLYKAPAPTFGAKSPIDRNTLKKEIEAMDRTQGQPGRYIAYQDEATLIRFIQHIALPSLKPEFKGRRIYNLWDQRHPEVEALWQNALKKGWIVENPDPVQGEARFQVHPLLMLGVLSITPTKRMPRFISLKPMAKHYPELLRVLMSKDIDPLKAQSAVMVAYSSVHPQKTHPLLDVAVSTFTKQIGALRSRYIAAGPSLLEKT